MDRSQLYDQMAKRKSKPKDFGTYIGDNGRVNRCVELFAEGKLKKGMTLLDVGGGIGDLGWAVRNKGFFTTTIVIDIAKKNLEAAQSKGNIVVRSDVDSQGFGPLIKDSSIDCVTALDFIEHIVDPESFAKECRRVLIKGGEVCCNTPNIQYFEHILSLIKGRFPHTSGDRDVFFGGHLANFTFDDLCEIFAGAGFDDFVQFDDVNYRQPPKFWTDFMNSKNQYEYVTACKRYGSQNLLFKATKK